MYAVICSNKYWQDINQVIHTRGEEILYNTVDKDIDLFDELEKVGRIAINTLILDISSIDNYDHTRLYRAVQHYRIKNGRTRIIIIAPNANRGNEFLHSMVLMGVYDIIVPAVADEDKESNKEELNFLSIFSALLETPSTYARAVKWLINDDITNETISPGENKGKIKEVIRTVSVPVEREGLKETIISCGWNGSGKSFFMTNLAVLLAQRGAKVALIEGNLKNRELGTFFQLDKNHQGLEQLIKLRNNDRVLNYAFSPVKNLYVFALLNLMNPLKVDFDLADIQDKLRGKVDFILVDGPSPVDSSFMTNFKYASKVYILINSNFAKLITLSQELNALANQGINLEKFDAVLNQYLPSKELAINSIKELIDIDIKAVVPPLYPMGYDSHIIGRPLCLSSKGDQIEEALMPIIDSLWNTPEPKKNIFSIFRRK